MKKMGICSAALVLIISFVFGGSASAADKSLQVAMILWRGKTIAEKGFQDSLKEFGYSVQYTILNAGQDRNELARLMRDRLRPNLGKFDYVYTFGTTVSKVAKIVINSRVPQIFNIVAAPVRAGLVRKMGASGGNISGVTNGVPLDLQMKTAKKAIPFRKLGLLFNPREKNSVAIRKNLYKISKELNFQVIDFRTFPSVNMLQENLSKIAAKKSSVDAVYLPQDSFVVSNSKLIGSQLRAARIKSIGSIKSYIVNGALMGIVPDYYELGKSAARILDRHYNGEKLQDIPIQKPQNPRLVINRTTSNALKIEFPRGLLTGATFIE